MSQPFGQKTSIIAGLTSAILIALANAPVLGADMAGDRITPSPAHPSAIATWDILVTPYGWLTGLKGTQTVKGRSSSVDASFVDIVKGSDTLVALMGNVEARRGPLALYTDLVWTKIGIGDDNVRYRSPAPGVTTSVGQSLDLKIQMMTFEAGAAYEFVRNGLLSFDVIGGARYWHQKADLSYEASISTDIGDLERVGSRAFARSGSVQWLDPLVGGRIRYAATPGHELFLRSDIGGFGAGSKFSWQAIAGYAFNTGTYKNLTFSGVLGYRALYVNYSKGSGTNRYEYDMLQYGPVLGLNVRF